MIQHFHVICWLAWLEITRCDGCLLFVVTGGAMMESTNILQNKRVPNSSNQLEK
jgi:hypothetical protein